jgi:hypothetical protein
MTFVGSIAVPSAAQAAFEGTFADELDRYEEAQAYANGELEEVEDDFNAPFADPNPPTAADLDAEAAYQAHLARMAGLDAYCEQRAEEAAAEWAAEHPDEDPEDYDPEPPAAPAAGRPERRAKYDGLTRSERANLYVAERYRVEQVGPI